ncbi:hypothetical protein K1T71_011668 [Dendrolimus kikuchii]|uniref:Uncharacterized protein n=1 Tax=Dendrolimus kikuchii TaxID=765133 RepID=A0ACC1CLQ8_9NEOP|nr:hypothetical protein K1T71_011668 [Dendrolimus kikuchii]
MDSIRPVPASRHSQPGHFTFKELATCSHVFLREDAVRRPLQPPYTGPYQVVERSSDGKTITINLKGKPAVVSVDRVKPAFREQHNTQDVRTPTPPVITPTPPAAAPLPSVPPPATPVSQPEPYITLSINLTFRPSAGTRTGRYAHYFPP